MRPYRTPDWEHVSGFYRWAYTVARKPLSALVPLRVHFEAPFPKEGGVVVACRHETWADPLLVAALLPRPTFFLAKAELFRHPWAERFFRANGAVPVYRDGIHSNEEALSFARERLKRGNVVLIFPEATRIPPGRTVPGKSGAVRLAWETGASLVAVGLSSYEFWPMGRRLPSLGKGAFVAVGPPRTLPPLGPVDFRRWTDELMGEIYRLTDQARRARSAGNLWGWGDRPT